MERNKLNVASVISLSDVETNWESSSGYILGEEDCMQHDIKKCKANKVETLTFVLLFIYSLYLCQSISACHIIRREAV